MTEPNAAPQEVNNALRPDQSARCPAGAAPLPEEPRIVTARRNDCLTVGSAEWEMLGYIDTLRARLTESEDARKRADIDKKRFERDWLEECDISHALKQRAEQAEAKLARAMEAVRDARCMQDVDWAEKYADLLREET